jgi:protease I
MIPKPLNGKKIAVIVEHKFIPEEIEAYRNGFTLLGAEVELISRIWYGDYKPGHAYWKQPVFYSDVDPGDNEAWASPVPIKVDEQKDISVLKPDSYAAVIMSANYTSVRLRYNDFDLKNIPADFDAKSLVRSAPVAKFFASIMPNEKIIKGALCHGLWILTPFPELLNKRNVICHTVVMADIINTGANIITNSEGVVIDKDLVTGYSKHQVLPFIEAIAHQIISLQ